MEAVMMVYPIILTETTDKKVPYLIYVPDFDGMSQGKSLSNAMEMAGDLIALKYILLENEGKIPPVPTPVGEIDPGASPFAGDDGVLSSTVALISVDIKASRKKLDHTSVRRNVSLPAWLDGAARKSKLNVSAILQRALKEELHISE
jgi:predicted RNase H-like HicB family nuclease